VQNESVAKGAVYLGISQFLFLLSGYVINIFLGRTLEPELFGDYSVVIYLITNINIIFSSGIPHSIAKYIAENPKFKASIYKSSNIIQIISSSLIFVIIFLIAPLISTILNDTSLVRFIRIASISFPFYALMSLQKKYFNGIRSYTKQSLIGIFYAIAKTGLIIGLTFFGLEVFGAVLGFSLAAIVGAIVGIIMTGLPIKEENSFDYKILLKFAWPVIISSFILDLGTSLDVYFLKASVINPDDIGYYSSATTIAKIPRLLLLALNIALFPLISKVSASKDLTKTKEILNDSIRYLSMLTIPIVIFVALVPKKIIILLYTVDYAPAGLPLGIKIFAMIFLTYFAFFLNIMTAIGKVKKAMVFCISFAVLSALTNLLLTLKYQMLGAAVAITIASLISMLLPFFYLLKKYGNFIPFLSFVKVSIATGLDFFTDFNYNLFCFANHIQRGD